MNKYRALFGLFVLAITAVLAGCAAPGATPVATVAAATPGATTAPATPGATTAPADNLAGSAWQLEEYGPASDLQPALATARPTLTFASDGQVSGFGGCNSFGGSYSVESDTISFSQVVSTLMACQANDVNEQEAAYLAALEGTGRFEQTAESLTVFYDNGQRELHFTPLTAGTEATSVPQMEATATPVTEATATPVMEATSTSGSVLGPLQQIEMIDATHGWAIGMGTGSTPATVLWTEDGGQVWHDRPPAQAQSGGVPGNAGPAASFASADAGWVSYGGAAPATSNDTFVVWHTEDGGQNWTASQPLPVADMTMEFFQPSDLVVNEDGFGWMLAHLGVGMSHDYIAVYTTTDSGVNWQRVADPDSAPGIQACPKSALRFTSRTDGWLAANCPGLMPPLPFYHTTDGGATWQQVMLPAPDAQTAPADSLGNQCGVPQMELVTPDTLVLTLRCVDFQQSNNAQAWLYTSDDGGQSWQTAALPVGTLTVDFLDANEGWLLGGADDQPGTTQQLYHSGDGGQTWQSLATVAAPGTPDFVDATHGWIVTKDGALLHSSDGGATWETVAAILAP